MQFLSISRRKTDEFPPETWTPELISAETARVRQLYADGILRQVWKRGDAAGAAIVWEAATLDEVKATIASLPIAKAGMLELVALMPLEPYPGFSS